MKPISYNTLHNLAGGLMDGHIKYGWGAKAKFTTAAHDIKALDCSGFVRYFLHHISQEKYSIAEGSWGQNEWCKAEGFVTEPYDNCALKDDYLRLGYFPQIGKEGDANFAAGHIWLVLNGKTLESYGGHGPGRRDWDTAKLKKSVKHCYRLAQVVKTTEPLALCLDLKRLRTFFHAVATARVAARNANVRYRQANLGILTRFSRLGFFEIDEGDPLLNEKLSSREYADFVDRFLTASRIGPAAAMHYLDALGSEARQNLKTLNEMQADARKSQVEFSKRITAIASTATRTKVLAESILSVTSLFVPAAGVISLGTDVTIKFVENWGKGTQANVLAIGGVAVKELHQTALTEGIKAELKAQGAKQYFKHAEFGVKFLFVANDLAGKIPVLINPRLAFDP